MKGFSTLGFGDDSEGELVGLYYTFNMIQSPTRYVLLALPNLMLGIGTGYQRFGNSSLAMNIHPVKLATNSFVRNRQVDVRIEYCSDLGSCGFVSWIQSRIRTPLPNSFPSSRQLLLFGVLQPSLRYVNMILATLQTCRFGHGCSSKIHTANLSSFQLRCLPLGSTISRAAMLVLV